MSRKPIRLAANTDGEFLWLISLSDLMILLFVFFVVLFSFSMKNMGADGLAKISQEMTGATAQTPLDEIQKKLLEWVVDRKLLESIDVQRKEDALIVEIREKLLFRSGDYRIVGENQEMVKLIGSALEKIPAPYRIGVEGHTDDRPLAASAAVHDNWELSVRRAHSVLEALQLSPPQMQRAVILGYGEMRPLAPNKDEAGKALVKNQDLNRRVTIRIF